MNDLDFTGRRVLVVGGTSGIGNGIAHGFRQRGARVAVWGTRDKADYRLEDGSDLSGLDFFRVDASDNAAVEPDKCLIGLTNKALKLVRC